MLASCGPWTGQPPCPQPRLAGTDADLAPWLQPALFGALLTAQRGDGSASEPRRLATTLEPVGRFQTSWGRRLAWSTLASPQGRPQARATPVWRLPPAPTPPRERAHPRFWCFLQMASWLPQIILNGAEPRPPLGFEPEAPSSSEVPSDARTLFNASKM